MSKRMHIDANYLMNRYGNHLFVLSNCIIVGQILKQSNMLLLIFIASVFLVLRNDNPIAFTIWSKQTQISFYWTYQAMSYNLSIENTFKAFYILPKMNFTLSVTDYKWIRWKHKTYFPQFKLRVDALYMDCEIKVKLI